VEATIITARTEGRKLGDFIVRERLGQGAFGTVYRAEQPALQRDAVIKVLHQRANPRGIERFLREARLASRLDHPYAAHIYAFGAEPDGLRWIAMELVRGTALDQLLRLHGPLSIDRFIPFLEQLCEVVHTAHEQGIVHRDIKPANVMVIARAGRLLPKLCDLGIAKLLDDHDTADAADGDAPPDRPEFTQRGAVIGSPLYMAPEQWADAAAVDARTDLYALGVLAYEALTGQVPFPGATRLAVASAHATQAPPPLGPRFPPELDAVIARALAKRRDDRPANALALAAAFRAASGLAAEPAALPQLAAAAREAALAAAPQPIADAVALLEAARNAHQARDAMWEIVRAAVRVAGIVALAARTGVGPGAAADAPPVVAALRALRRRALGDGEWVELARERARPFAAHPDAHPVPELVTAFFPRGDAEPADPFAAVLACQAEVDHAGATSDAQVRRLLANTLPHVAALLDALAFLHAYPLVVVQRGVATRWMGARRSPRATLAAGAPVIPDGRAVLVDAGGRPLLSLWPLAQLAPPMPGAPDELFFLDGNARRGARLVTLPGGFERQDDELWTWFGEHLLDTADEVVGAAAEPQAPYLGLAAFGAGDAANYVGREREVQAVVNRLRVCPLLAIVGPSGVGKSSFVHAGVVPSLPPGWRAIALRPGAAPLTALRARLTGELGAVPSEDPEALAAGLRAAVPAGETRVVIVDQFEELFTLGSAPAERVAFAAVLAAIARAADDPLRVVVTLRDDFLMRAEQLAPLRERLPVSLELLGVPAAAELRRIVIEPAHRAGYDFDDPALVDEMVAAVAGQPGALPLLSFTAAELWKRRNRHFHQLSRRAYHAIGGVGGALADHAEAVRARLIPDEQRLLREAFRHLVTAEGTRAVLTRSELAQLLGGGGHAETVIEQLVGGRLLVATDGERGEQRVEVIHESLLAAWPRLAEWRHEDAEGAWLRDQLRAAARQWEERGRPRGLLWRDELLAEYRLWRARLPGALTAAEEAFAAAALADAVRGRRTRRMLVIGAFAVLAAGMAVLWLSSVEARRARAHAEVEQRAAVASSQESRGRLIALYVEEGRERVIAGDPLRGIPYLAEAYRDRDASAPGLRYLIGHALEALAVQRMVLAHADVVWSVAFSPDDERVVTASGDRTARIWQASTGALLATLTGHTDAVSFAAFIDGGVVTAGFDGRVGVWAGDGARRTLIQGHTDRIWSAGLSPDRRRLVTAGWDGVAIVWDLATGRPERTLRGHTDKLWSAAFSADGRRVITASLDHTARIWNAATGALVATLAGHRDGVRHAELSADGALAVTASADGTARLWDAATGAPRAVLAGHRGKVHSARLSPDGTRVLTASDDNTAKIWELDGRLVHSLDGHHGYVSAALWRGEGATIVTASGDQTARLWDATTGRALGAFVGHVDSIVAAQLASHGGGFATASEDGTARLWNPDAIRRPIALVGHVRPEASTEAWSGGVFAVAFSRDGAWVWTSGDDNTVRLWDARDGHLVRTIATGAAGPAAAAGFSADDTRFVTVGPAGATLWDAAAGRPLRAFAARDTTDAQLSPDGAELATAHGDGKARIVDVASGALRVALAGHTAALTAVRWSADGRRVVTASDDRTAIVWDARRGTRLATLTGHHLAVLSAAFSPDGAYVVTASRDKTARLWDAATGGALSTMDGHNQEVNAAAFSPDGTMIVTAGADATAKLWDRATGKEIDSLALHGRAVECVAFSRDGTRIVTGAWDDLAAVWTLPAPAPDPAQVERFVRCEVPFELVDGKLFRSGANSAACLDGGGR
jgi:WD40 repeat protein